MMRNGQIMMHKSTDTETTAALNLPVPDYEDKVCAGRQVRTLIFFLKLIQAHFWYLKWKTKMII